MAVPYHSVVETRPVGGTPDDTVPAGVSGKSGPPLLPYMTEGELQVWLEEIGMGASVRAALAEHHLDGAGCTELDDRFDFDDLGIEKKGDAKRIRWALDVEVEFKQVLDDRHYAMLALNLERSEFLQALGLDAGPIKVEPQFVKKGNRHAWLRDRVAEMQFDPSPIGPASVSRWLTSIGMGQYIPAFAAHDIDGQSLLDLGSGDLSSMGVVIMAHRKRMLVAIGFLKREYEINMEYQAGLRKVHDAVDILVAGNEGWVEEE